jgi:DeoR/GlpR family transcriptional regulator of sugar metabolism
MYFPTTCVLTVLELLQSHQRLSGPELAERLEVDTRTVRRYITNGDSGSCYPLCYGFSNQCRV